MSTQPLPIRRPTTQSAEQRKNKNRISDYFYFSGGALLSAGAGCVGIRYALMTAGAVLLFPPLLELAGSFIKGVRVRR